MSGELAVDKSRHRALFKQLPVATPSPSNLGGGTSTLDGTMTDPLDLGGVQDRSTPDCPPHVS